MVEYLYDAIKTVAGQEAVINAVITDDNEQDITQGCMFILHDVDGHKVKAMIGGSYLGENGMWEFRIPASVTTGLSGRYWYCIQHNESNLCFKQPIYLV